MEEPKSIHFVGIGGIGMSGIAAILLDSGCEVSGSDLKLSSLTEKLESQGARIFQGHAREHVGDVDLVVISSAVRDNNPEILAALEKGIPVIKRAEMLGRLMAKENRYGIAVAGTHGKTTTSSMISVVLEVAGYSPTIVVGGEIVGMESNAKTGQGEYIVVEADEYDGSFLKLSPRLAVITNIEADHLDFYKSFDGIFEAFRAFAHRIPADGHLVACLDDENVRSLLASISLPNKVTYGLNSDADWTAKDLEPNDWGGTDFKAFYKGRFFRKFKLRVPGRHNVANALAAIACAHILGLDTLSIAVSLGSFRGAHRRFEIMGEANGVTVVDDYGHHPTEVRATLRTARERFEGRRIVCLFQPHTYSRTKLLLNEFATCFADADLVVIADIYAARESDTLGIDSQSLVGSIDHKNALYGGNLESCVGYLTTELKSGDVLFTVGAGDVNRVAGEILTALSQAAQS